MTDYNSVPIVATGDWIDDAWINTYIGDNLRALWPYATAGDTSYALDNNTLARLAFVPGGLSYGAASFPAYLARPAGLSLLKHAGPSAFPAYFSAGGAAKLLAMNAAGNDFEWVSALHKIGSVTNYAGGQSTSSSSPVDVTGMSLNLVLTKPSTIMVFGSLVGYTSNGSYPIIFQTNINGTGVGDFRSYALNAAVGVGIGAHLAAVPAGTRTVKMQFLSPFTISVTTFGGFIVAMAIAD